jgi:hypothetical protein
MGVGRCQAGSRTCERNGEFGGMWGECEGAVFPDTEECGNLIDDDCDGMTDEGCSMCPSQTLTAPTSEAGVVCTDTFPATFSGWEGYSPRSRGNRCRGPECLTPGNTCTDTSYFGTISGGSRGTCLNYCAVRARCNSDGTWTVTGFTW